MIQIKEVEIEKKEVKTSTFANSMILYRKGPKNSTTQFLQLINTFVKVAGYKNYIQNSVAFLYKNERHSKKKKVREAIQLIIL